MEEMSIFRSRSFWLIIAALVIGTMDQRGITLPIGDEELATLFMELTPMFLSVWAYIERYFGKKKLKVITNAG